MNQTLYCLAGSVIRTTPNVLQRSRTPEFVRSTEYRVEEARIV